MPPITPGPTSIRVLWSKRRYRNYRATGL